MVTKQKVISAVSMGISMVPVHQIYWFYDRNPRLDFDEQKFDDRKVEILGRSFLRTRWDSNFGVAQGVTLSAADRKFGFQLRTERWNALKAAAKGAGPDADPIYTLKAFEDLYCTDPGTPNAKLIPPGEDAVEGITCYRRSIGIWRAAYLVESNSVKKVDVNRSAYETDEPIPQKWFEDFTVPVNVYAKLSDEDRLVIQLRENEGKNEGAEKLDEKDRFVAGCRLFDKGDQQIRQARFRDAFSAGTGQKIYGILAVDSLYPELSLKRRVLAAFGLTEDYKASDAPIENLSGGNWSYTGDQCPVSFSKLDKVVLGQFSRKSPVEKPKKFTNDRFGVEEYIMYVLGGAGAKKVASMDQAAMIKLADNLPFQQFKLALESAINNDTTAINAFANIPGCRDAHMALFALCKHGHALEAAKALHPIYMDYKAEIDAAEKVEREAREKALQQAKLAAESVTMASGHEHTESEFVDEDAEVSEGVELAVAGSNVKVPASKKTAGKKGGRKK